MNQCSSEDKRERRPARPTGAWVAIGAGSGVALGVALDNIGLGLATGVGVRVAIGAAIAALDQRRKPDDRVKGN